MNYSKERERVSEKTSVKRIALLAMLTAVTHVSRLAFQFLPNVQPVTAILLILTLTMSTKDALIVAVLSIVLSNITLGMGVWTFAQILSFAVVVICTVSLKPIQHRVPLILHIVFAGAMGYLYGFIISLVQAPFFGIQNFWVYYMSGLPFDTMHALGNAGFYAILWPILPPIIRRFMNK